MSAPHALALQCETKTFCRSLPIVLDGTPGSSGSEAAAARQLRNISYFGSGQTHHQRRYNRYKEQHKYRVEQGIIMPAAQFYPALIQKNQNNIPRHPSQEEIR
jgi:hypothetical protein